MKVLLVTPPFTQLNTPYPATAYIKGFLNTLGVSSFQVDLSLEVALDVFSKQGLQHVFDLLIAEQTDLSENGFRVFSQRKRYIATIEPVIHFLQHKNPTLALTICAGGYLPEGARFSESDDLDWAFGNLGTHDRARHLATLYLEDLGDLLSESVDTHFGFSRYAERLGRTATDFAPLYNAITREASFILDLTHQKLETHLMTQKPDLVCLTAPFPGNVMAAFSCGYYIKTRFPDIKVCFGGGYANTELRRVFDPRVFDCVDFITLDDGEAPLQHLLEYLGGSRPVHLLKRTFCRIDGEVRYINGSKDLDIPQREVGTPDYRDLLLDKYISVIEVANPMHRLWSDGRWNKMTLAHGCYWGKCSFCDVSLDYISRYEPVSAVLLCDRIEEIISQTGQHGFHFVDEAAPPALMRDLALEIIRRQLTVVWWTNIRFEKSFTYDLCRLLRESGCIAVSGGLEVASDRLLEKMKKGVTVAQVATVADAFTRAGIMVHAYLMYGFPTQTEQETIDSLERVRQLFESGALQSAFWHEFAMTAHSPVGLDPAAYGVVHTGPHFEGFAENDFFHDDPTGADHEKFAAGLKTSLFNYMHGVGLDLPVNDWFEFKTPMTTVQRNFIKQCLVRGNVHGPRDTDLVYWLGGDPVEVIHLSGRRKKNKEPDESYCEVVISGKTGMHALLLTEIRATWFLTFLETCQSSSDQKTVFRQFSSSYRAATGEDIAVWMASSSWEEVRKSGLVFL